MLKQIDQGGCVASIGLAAGDGWDASVIPFILRGVTMAGVDSVMQPYEARVAAWDRLASLFKPEIYEPMVSEAGLADLPELAPRILAGKVKGRIVVKPAS